MISHDINRTCPGAVLVKASFVDLLTQSLVPSQLKSRSPSLVEHGFLLSDLVALEVVEYLQRVFAVVGLKMTHDVGKRRSGRKSTYVGQPNAEKTAVLAVTEKGITGEDFGAALDQGDQLLSAIITHVTLLGPIHVAARLRIRARSRCYMKVYSTVPTAQEDLPLCRQQCRIPILCPRRA
jgi:hypothetical protein